MPWLASVALAVLWLASTAHVGAATYFVAPDGQGDDGAGGLTPAEAWATADHAVTRVSAGDTVFFLAGTHTRATSLAVPEGVSLTGDGPDSVLHVIVAADYSWGFVLASPTVNAPGDQSISHLRFVGDGDDPTSLDGNITGAIWVSRRGGVNIHDCEFEDFDDNAVTFAGQGHSSALPGAWAVGNAFVDNVVINCSKEQLPGQWMSGALQIGAQQDMEIAGNTIDETARGTGSCGYNIKYYAGGWNRGLAIHHNTFRKLPAGPSWNDWNFAIELWHWMGGVEIFDNVIEGSIDVDHAVAGDEDFAVRIHNNTFGYEQLPTSSGAWATLNAAVYIEFSCHDVEISNNLIRNVETAFRFSPRDGDHSSDIRIHHNVIHSLGNDTPGDDVGCSILNFAGQGSWAVSDLVFEHNTVFTDVGAAGWGLVFPAQSFDHVYIRNNIIQGFDSYPVEYDGAQTDWLFIQNNDFFGNGVDEAHVVGSPSNFTSSGNVAVPPEFSAEPDDLTLRASSNCIDAGLDLGYDADAAGHPVPIGPAPDLGAYEWGSAAPLLTDGFESGDFGAWSATSR